MHYYGLSGAKLHSLHEIIQVEVQASKPLQYKEVWAKVAQSADIIKASDRENWNKVVWLKEEDAFVKVRFDNDERNHNKELSKFIKSLMVVYKEVDVLKFVLGMLHIFKQKNLVGKK